MTDEAEHERDDSLARFRRFMVEFDRESDRAAVILNDQWRICFHWIGTDAHDVAIVDYH
jgi:plasmid maintenance system killer protein